MFGDDVGTLEKKFEATNMDIVCRKKDLSSAKESQHLEEEVFKSLTTEEINLGESASNEDDIGVQLDKEIGSVDEEIKGQELIIQALEESIFLEAEKHDQTMSECRRLQSKLDDAAVVDQEVERMSKEDKEMDIEIKRMDGTRDDLRAEGQRLYFNKYELEGDKRRFEDKIFDFKGQLRFGKMELEFLRKNENKALEGLTAQKTDLSKYRDDMMGVMNQIQERSTPEKDSPLEYARDKNTTPLRHYAPFSPSPLTFANKNRINTPPTPDTRTVHRPSNSLPPSPITINVENIPETPKTFKSPRKIIKPKSTYSKQVPVGPIKKVQPPSPNFSRPPPPPKRPIYQPASKDASASKKKCPLPRKAKEDDPRKRALIYCPFSSSDESSQSSDVSVVFQKRPKIFED